MDLWVLWLVAGCVFAAGEIATTGFFLGPFAVGAFAAMGVDLIGAPDALSIVVFFVISMATFGFLRPIARRHTQMPPQIRTGTAALEGASALALERIDADHGTVKLDGEVWTARTYLDDQVLEAGTRVQVIKIKGATALVSD
jgi:membrane protein implicated in regulation of membrane protease activity